MTVTEGLLMQMLEHIENIIRMLTICFPEVNIVESLQDYLKTVLTLLVSIISQR